ncbi:hypothetical protein DERP_001306 [Dermatophagoides pteronyssinus]|uniref:Uncharacterized protein n=1 Tax=Dermatophagoides pteronyssinus TaxID=6956 RepID=A0ABQ8JEK8_DERPT|nr:hypothetical protein DERP_001306 [Dermatophagoides pteronyssinus]
MTHLHKQIDQLPRSNQSQINYSHIFERFHAFIYLHLLHYQLIMLIDNLTIVITIVNYCTY